MQLSTVFGDRALVCAYLSLGLLFPGLWEQWAQIFYHEPCISLTASWCPYLNLSPQTSCLPRAYMPYLRRQPSMSGISFMHISGLTSPKHQLSCVQWYLCPLFIVHGLCFQKYIRTPVCVLIAPLLLWGLVLWPALRYSWSTKEAWGVEDELESQGIERPLGSWFGSRALKNKCQPFLSSL